MLTQAIVCEPAETFSRGLKMIDLGEPEIVVVRIQHQQYRKALELCGLRVSVLGQDNRYPDSTFVEDTAVILETCAVITRPGAPSRLGEIEIMGSVLANHFEHIETIKPPGFLDGGDVCDAGGHFFIGVSKRTNHDGAAQLAKILRKCGYSSDLIDIRNITEILHLKSGLSYLPKNNLVVIDPLADEPAFHQYRLIRVDSDEGYAANCVSINRKVLMPLGFPKLYDKLRRDYELVRLEMSEFQKMDGGLSCLSLRF